MKDTDTGFEIVPIVVVGCVIIETDVLNVITMHLINAINSDLMETVMLKLQSKY